jgi:hypothetical protein
MLKQTSFRKDGQNIFKQQQYEVSFIYLFFYFMSAQEQSEVR